IVVDHLASPANLAGFSVSNTRGQVPSNPHKWLEFETVGQQIRQIAAPRREPPRTRAHLDAKAMSFN
ncbi:hypothetical protein, partial [Mycobacterium sp. SMC-17]|uniref:hypothetical protein n=1 Tax=Mycobacterium sp. SMC-17 TaxID=3381628 RepID=UPI00387607CC